MFKRLPLLLLPLALTATLGAAEPPASPPVPATPTVPAVMTADTAAFSHLLDVLYGEAEEASLPPAGAEPAKPARLTGAAAKAEPLFVQAAARRQAGDAAAARQALRQILALPHLDSRRALRAWKGLRDLRDMPEAAVAGQVLGVVAEIDYEVEGGEHAILTVAGYAEGDPVLAASSGYSLLGAKLRSRTVASGKHLVTVAQPFLADLPLEEGRRLPGSGQIRFALLTPGGAHVREAARRDLEADPAGLHPLYVAAQQLLVALRLESERLEDARKP